LTDATWSDLEQRGVPPVVVVPIGSCEQHGPHLPLGTDTLIARELSNRLASREPDLLVAPTLAITSSGEHRGFPGTLSIGADATELMLVELVRSADWSAGVVLVNGHGGNRVPVDRAAERLHAEGRRVLAWWPRADGGDAHAGHTETSLMLALNPSLVRLDRAETGRTEPVGELTADLVRSGVRAVSPNGVLGDPTRASPRVGMALLERWSDELLEAVRRWRA
jgi:creatinine amidohydrolase